MTASLTQAMGQLQRSGKQSGGKVLSEPRTGVEFESKFCQRGNSGCGDLTGTGARSKKIVGLKNINVYALGLYVDSDATKRRLGRYKDVAALPQKGFDELIKAEDVEKTLHLVMTFGRVSPKTFWNALEDRIAPKMKAAGEADKLDVFARTFESVQFRKGMPIDFCVARGNALTTRVDGAPRSTVRSAVLCRALLDIYLGPDPVSRDAKAAFAAGIAGLLK